MRKIAIYGKGGIGKIHHYLQFIRSPRIKRLQKCK